MRTADRKTYARGGHLGNNPEMSPLSNPEIPMKNPITKNPLKRKQHRKTYQAAFQRKGCGGILKKKGCGGIMSKCRGGRFKRSSKT